MDNMRLCEEHRRYHQIFYLEKMLKEAGYPYYFNFNADYPDIIWDEYNFRIEIGHKAGYRKPMLEIFCDDNMLKLYVYRNNQTPESEEAEFFDSLMAEDCMLMIEELFNKYLLNSTQKHSMKC